MLFILKTRKHPYSLLVERKTDKVVIQRENSDFISVSQNELPKLINTLQALHSKIKMENKANPLSEPNCA